MAPIFEPFRSVMQSGNCTSHQMCDVVRNNSKEFEPWKVYVATRILYLKPAVIIAITGIGHPSPLIAR